ncbi:MAG: hypothetical protein J6J44_01030 [Lachnospiraceae bacterium]|nr:hypothetical protein [Lachnospiraceae bacterium]
MKLYNYDYDLKNENPKLRDCNGDALYKFLLYKAEDSSFDCDRCSYIREIYDVLWGFKKENASFQPIVINGKTPILMGMDTINSFWTTFAYALNKWCIKDIEEVYGIKQVTTADASTLLKRYAALKDIISKNLSKAILDKFILFAQLTHTLGNFVLVPKHVEPYTTGTQTFNTARASKWNDYFDLSLIWIFNNAETVWRSENIGAYLRKFFLYDYADVEDGIYPLIPSHKEIIDGKYSKESRPQTKKELSLLLDAINHRIIKRGREIHEYLCEKKTDVEIEQYPCDEKASSESSKEIVSPLVKATYVKSAWFYSIALIFTLAPFLLYFTADLLFFLSPNVIGYTILIILVGLECYGLVKIAKFLARKRKEKHEKAGHSAVPIEIRKMKSHPLLGISFLFFQILFLYAYITEGNDFSHISDILELLTYISTLVLFPWECIFLIRSYRTRCRQCKGWFLLKKMKRENEGGHEIEKEVEVADFDYVYDPAYDREMERHFFTTEVVRGKRTYYRQPYQCKWCGTIHYYEFTIDKMKDKNLLGRLWNSFCFWLEDILPF